MKLFECHYIRACIKYTPDAEANRSCLCIHIYESRYLWANTA